jgi:hypothetical protein
MAVATVTVTGKIGPGFTATANTFVNVQQITIDAARQMLRLLLADDTIREYDTSAATTVTCTISAGNYTFTIS